MDSRDHLIIDTPEQTSLEFPLAGIGSRFLALAADTAIQAGIGFVIFIAGQSKRLGDYVAGTVVVHETALEGVRPFAETRVDQSLPAFDASSITVDELKLIETFIQRRDSLDPGLRSYMASQFAARLGDKLQVKVYGWPRTENFLEAVLQQCRERGQFRG